MSTVEQSSVIEQVPRGFNWAAFLFTPLFLFCNRRVGTGILLMLAGGIVGAITAGGAEPIAWLFGLLTSAYFGSVGNQIAWDTGRYTSQATLKRSMRRWNIVAVIVLVLLIVLAALVSFSD